jgi:hypothetical protein
MIKIELFYFAVAKNCVSTARHCRAVLIFYLSARIRFNLIRAVKIFLSSSRDFEKKFRADAFRAVQPDSFIHLVMEKVT